MSNSNDFWAQQRELERKRLERTGGLKCPRCGRERPYITHFKGLFKNTPAYRCPQCGHTWAWWKDGKDPNQVPEVTDGEAVFGCLIVTIFVIGIVLIIVFK